MPAISIATPFNIDLEFATAPIGKRVLAFLIDCVILWLYWLAFAFAVVRALPDNDALQTIIIVLGYVLPTTL